MRGRNGSAGSLGSLTDRAALVVAVAAAAWWRHVTGRRMVPLCLVARAHDRRGAE